jgi:cell division protein FtsL
MLTRINIMLVTLLVLCALGLVTSQHRARKLFIEVERTHANAAAHEVRWNQLKVEQTELAKSARIDARARGELGMQSVPAERTLHLSIDPNTRQVSLSQPWREAAPTRGVRAAAARATSNRNPLVAERERSSAIPRSVAKRSQGNAERPAVTGTSERKGVTQ